MGPTLLLFSMKDMWPCPHILPLFPYVLLRIIDLHCGGVECGLRGPGKSE
ncbi:hypothetical protein GA0071314_1183 [Halomonas sp. HL-93]|nr:hypothetical protein GA0071314_1183 [Halomonas sp. HL-93]